MVNFDSDNRLLPDSTKPYIWTNVDLSLRFCGIHFSAIL